MRRAKQNWSLSWREQRGETWRSQIRIWIPHTKQEERGNLQLRVRILSQESWRPPCFSLEVGWAVFVRVCSSHLGCLWHLVHALSLLEFKSNVKSILADSILGKKRPWSSFYWLEELVEVYQRENRNAECCFFSANRHFRFGKWFPKGVHGAKWCQRDFRESLEGMLSLWVR